MSPESTRWKLVSERLNEIRSIRHVVDFLADMDNWSLSGLEECVDYDKWIQQSYEKVQHSPRLRQEIVRYIPIGFVACIEGYFRLVCANLIDYGSPYKDNSVELRINLTKFEPQLVSLGEFIGHRLRINRLDDINSHINILTGKNFAEELKLARKKFKGSIYAFGFSEDDEPGLINIDDKLHNGMLVSIEKLFELRHQFCHEIDPIFSKDEDFIVAYSQAVIEFIWLSEKFFQELLS
jgi:hypothetical protein